MMVEGDEKIVPDRLMEILAAKKAWVKTS